MPPSTYHILIHAASALLAFITTLTAVAHTQGTTAPPPEPDSAAFAFKAQPDTTVAIVTSLADFGPGTLRACAEARGPRACLFSVAGSLTLSRPIRVRSPDLLIAGETAPRPGITLRGSGLSIETHNVEVRHLAIRPGDGPIGAKPSDRDGVSIGAEPPLSAHHVSLDHLSLTWAIDENLSAWYPTTHDISVTNSIIAEGLQQSIHPKGKHSKGVLIGRGVRRVTLSRNLIAFNEERNPYIEPAASAKLLNNLIYGWGPRGPWSICNLTNNDHSNKPVRVALIGNVFVPGPHSFSQSAPVYAKRIAPGSVVFTQDNKSLIPNLAPDSLLSLPSTVAAATACPFTSGCKAPLSSSETEEFVLTHAGSRPTERAAPDMRIVQHVRDRAGDLKDCLQGCRRAAGPVELSPMRRRALSPPTNPAGDDNGDGKSNLDEWLEPFLRTVEDTDGAHEEPPAPETEAEEATTLLENEDWPVLRPLSHEPVAERLHPIAE